jgi:hexulose-6-phosphate isomerase
MVTDSMLGVMQGRLSPVRNGRIQSFPWETWEDEFPLAKQLGFECLEWTIDSERISDNPLYCSSGLKSIRELIDNTGIKVESVTCDFFMENPPWESALAFEFNVDWLNRLVGSSEQVGISYIVIPLVDNSSIKQDANLNVVFDCIEKARDGISNVYFLFEGDFSPKDFSNIMEGLDEKIYGVNLDIGNSASLGWDPELEVRLLAKWIKNVHIKDRKYLGPSVHLGEGDTDFETYFKTLSDSGYPNNYIFQTARANPGEHILVMNQNLKYIKDIMNRVCI